MKHFYFTFSFNSCLPLESFIILLHLKRFLFWGGKKEKTIWTLQTDINGKKEEEGQILGLLTLATSFESSPRVALTSVSAREPEITPGPSLLGTLTEVTFSHKWTISLIKWNWYLSTSSNEQPPSLAPTLKYPQGSQYNFIWPLAKDCILLDHQFPPSLECLPVSALMRNPLSTQGGCSQPSLRTAHQTSLSPLSDLLSLFSWDDGNVHAISSTSTKQTMGQTMIMNCLKCYYFFGQT